MSFSTNKTLAFSISILVLYFMPWVLLGKNSYILIHDNLDSNLVWFKTLVESKMLFSTNYSQLVMFMDAPRVSFGSEFNIQLLFYYFFEPYTAYVVNQIFIRTVAFFGMYFLLNNYVFDKKYSSYNILISLSFSLLPFWPSGGLSIAGLPLITYVFLNIKTNKATLKNYISLMLFPFYSSFIISMMFYIFVLGLVWLNELRQKRINKSFTLSLFIFIFLYILINYRLFEAFFISTDFMSHRIERVADYKTFFESLKSSINHFIKGQYHTSSLHIIFLPFIIYIFIHNIRNKNKNKLITNLFLLNVVISMWYGFWKFEGWTSIKESISLLNSLNLSRFHSLAPLIWYVLFGLSVKYFFENVKFEKKKLLILFIISINIVYLFSKSDYVQTYKKENITYKQFYSEKLFNKIDNYIQADKSGYKVVSIGIHPSIARYNGFYTADGYLTNYSLKYKHEFEKIISKELEKNKRLKKSFENWGNRCYLFVDEVGYNFIRKKDKTYPINIEINANALKELGVKYIFSSYKIKNAQDNRLIFVKLFKDKEAAWDIYLYKVKEKK